MKNKKVLLIVLSFLVAALMVQLSGCYFNTADFTFRFGSPQKNHTHVDSDSDNKCDVCGIDMGSGNIGDDEFEYKTPTRNFAEWQEYTKEQYVAEDVSSKTVVYQFSAEDVALREGRYYDILINLYADGFAKISQYCCADGYVIEYYGYWTNMDDSIYFGVSCHTNTRMPNKTYGISYSYNLTWQDGAFADFGLSLALGFAEGGQFVRSYTMSGDGTVVYEAEEKFEERIGFKQADFGGGEDEKPGDETKELLFSFKSDSENYLLDFNKDGTYKFMFKTAGLEEEGTWEWKNWTLTIINKNGKSTVATRDADTNTLTIEFVAAINDKVKRTFTCESSVWGVAFGGKGDYILPAQATVLFSFASGSENYLLDIYTDGTYTFTFKTAGLVEKGTWEWKSWSFSLTDFNGKTTTATRDAETRALILEYVSATSNRVTRTFTCESSVWGVAFGGKGDYTV